MSREYTDEQILTMIQRCAEEQEKVTPRAFKQYDEFCSPALAIRRFGGWTEAKRRAGVEESAPAKTGRQKQYSDEQLLSHLREVERRHGRCTTRLLRQEDDLCSPSVVAERFKDPDSSKGGWRRAKEEAGLAESAGAAGRPAEYSDEDYLELLRECEKKHGKVTQRLFDEDDSFPSSVAVRKRFGGWNVAKEQAGVEQSEHSYTEEELLQQLRKCAERYGDCTVDLFAEDDEFASPSTVHRHFGSWNTAKEQAGLIDTVELTGYLDGGEGEEVTLTLDQSSIERLREVL